MQVTQLMGSFIHITDPSLPIGQCEEMRGQPRSQAATALSAAKAPAVPVGQRLRLQEGPQAQQVRLQRASGAQVQKGE